MSFCSTMPMNPVNEQIRLLTYCAHAQSDLGLYCLHIHEKPLRKQAYSNILKILPPKNENFQIKILIFFISLLKT